MRELFFHFHCQQVELSDPYYKGLYSQQMLLGVLTVLEVCPDGTDVMT